MRTIVDIHVVQSVPPSNVNRDDTGSPKTAAYGGVRRARVSSQAWKRATRLHFSDRFDRNQLGVRTKRIVEVLAAEISSQGADEAAALELAKQVLTAGGLKLAKPKKRAADPEALEEAGYLIFLSRFQIHALAELALSGVPFDTREAKKRVKDELTRQNSIDLALFGRMVADDPNFNVDASCQVAHAISVHRVISEFDYFTAVDDVKAASDEEDAGAGMIGNVEFNSSTLYRYATVDVNALEENLGDAAATRRAVIEFLRSFVTSMPTGKQNTFANRTLPHLVHVTVRDDQPVNLVGAFEVAIPASADGYAGPAVSRLAAHAGAVGELYGLTPVAAWSAASETVQGLGELTTFPGLIESLGVVLGERLQVP